MKKILGLDLGTNSIGWALIEQNFSEKKGSILGAGSRIIPMSQDVLGNFDAGVSVSQTAERTSYRSTRKLYHRDNLRRERLHRVLNLIGFLPEHYKENIDFEKRLGQFKKETKLNYRKEEDGSYEFLFEGSFKEMIKDFRSKGYLENVPKDWTIYYLRSKALQQKISKYELAWVILNFNQKRGYYQLRGEDVEEDKNKQFVQLKVAEVNDIGEKVKGNALKKVVFENGWEYDKFITNTENWIGKVKEFIVTTKKLASGDIKRTFKVVNSEQDWPAIKAKTENDIDESGLSIGQYIYKNLLADPTVKIKGKLVKTIERKYYKNELYSILEKQKEYHPELIDNDLYKRSIEELYLQNAAHRNNISDKGFTYLFLDDIVFYQRPLKSKKSTISGCQFESRSYQIRTADNSGNKMVKAPIKAIPKSHPQFQEFRLWQFVVNLNFIDLEKELLSNDKKSSYVTNKLLKTEDDFVELFGFLNEKKEVGEPEILKYFIKIGKISKEEANTIRWNYVRDKKYPCNTTRFDFVNRLKKVNNVDPSNFLTTNKEIDLWHIIYSVKDKKQYLKALKTFGIKNNLDSSFIESFKSMPPYPNSYSTFSQKAIRKLLALMRMGKYWSIENIDQKTIDRINKIITGEFDKTINDRVREKSINLKEINDFRGLPLWLSSYIIYGRHSEVGELTKWEKPSDIDAYLDNFKQHSLRNPIVEQVVTETLRTVRDIWNHYGEGKANFFDGIHIELGREIKNSKDKRKQITSKISENQRTNERIVQLLEELNEDESIKGDVKAYSPSHQELLKLYEDGVHDNPEVDYSIISEDEVQKIRRNNKPSKNDIIRYKLWLEQGYISPYTGRIISLSKLFTTDYEIEHIIPQSRYFDNSLGNKIICESDVNSDKGNMTAFEYINKRSGDTVDGHTLFTIGQYESHVEKYFSKNRTKLRNLLSPDIPEGFINRQLNDSRYISKFIKGILSNIVRDEEEQESKAKNLQPFSGSITSKLRQDWGLNDKWNELVSPRFKRLNELTGTSNFGYIDKKIGAFRIQVPNDLRKGFSKKRIDHRHHALDAIVIACATPNHINYLTSLETERNNFSLRTQLLIKNKHGDFTKHFQHPWSGFSLEVKECLERVVVSFKSNNRVINKTNNKTWQWVKEEGGELKKRKVKQVVGNNWAIRKPLHKETVAGLVTHINTPKGKIATSSRVPLNSIKNEKHIDKVTDQNIQKILRCHLNNFKKDNGKYDYEKAFSEFGIDELNKNIFLLNGNKPHKPIKKVKQYEIGKKFTVGHSGNNKSKYVEAAKGTNMFFAIYWNEEERKRVYNTVPLNEVIEHQKQVSHLPKKDRLPIQPDPSKGQFLFTLSPNDIVYVPNDSEVLNPRLVDFNNLSKDQTNSLYKMVSCTSNQCHFIPINNAKEIMKNENGTNSKHERVQHECFKNPIVDVSGKGVIIKKRCWKLIIDRTGSITNVFNNSLFSD